MRTYRAGYIADPLMRAALKAIEEAANRADPFSELEVLDVEPLRVRAGMVVYADGVNFNPGSGEGLYRREKTNTSWVFIG